MADRLLFVWLYRLFPSVLNAVTIVQPETVIRWHRAGFRLALEVDDQDSSICCLTDERRRLARMTLS